MNWVQTITVGIFSLDMIFKTWYITLNPDLYRQYTLKMTNSPVPTQSDDSAQVL